MSEPKVPTLNQAGWIQKSSDYQFDPSKYPNLSITGENLALFQSNWRRWSMLHNSSGYYLYVFKGHSRDTLYQYKWDGKSYALDNDTPEITLLDVPEYIDPSSFSMVNGESYDQLFMRWLGNPTSISQWMRVPGTATFKMGAPRDPHISGYYAIGYPADTDWARWMMVYDGMYRLYAFKLGSNTQFYQGSWNASQLAYEYGYPPSAPNPLNLVGTPANSNLASAAMLHDETSTYRFYFQTILPP